MTDNYLRFDVSGERALSVAGCASVALSSLLALEQHEKEAELFLENLRSEIGAPGEPGAESATELEIRASKTALFDQVQALRRDVADLAADAATLLPSPNGASTIVIPKDLPLPRLDLPTPLALAEFQRWYAQGAAIHTRDAARNADQLVRHLSDSDDPETMNLCAALKDFAQGVRGQGSGPRQPGRGP